MRDDKTRQDKQKYTKEDRTRPDEKNNNIRDTILYHDITS